MLRPLKHTMPFRLYTRLTEAERTIFYSCLFSMGLVFSRVIHTGRPLYLSMIWNLFLAFIPYAVSRVLSSRKLHLGSGVMILGAIVWLLFIPNSFYIITDLFHLD